MIYIRENYRTIMSKSKRRIKIIHNEFALLSPDNVIWDIEDLNKQPPWGKNISQDIKIYLTILLHRMVKIYLVKLKSI